MKKNIVFALLCAMFICIVSGCGWMDGEYVFEEPSNLENSGNAKNAIVVSSYSQMCNALANLIESGADDGIFDVSNFNDGSVRFFMDAAIRYVTTSNAMGAYAVDGITYEIGTSTGDQAVAVNIQYRFGREHVMKIVMTYGMDEAKQALAEAMQSFKKNLILRVSRYEELDILQWSADYALMHPETVIEVPKIDMHIYPRNGTDRIIVFDFTYSYNTAELMEMQRTANTILNTPSQNAEQPMREYDRYVFLYHFLVDGGVFTLDKMTDTPVYSVLVNKTGDSASFANVYALLCARAGLECYVVPGTCDDQPRVWNIIRFDDKYYHFDLLECSQNQEFAVHVADEMSGYVWDYGSFPN